MGFGSHKIYKLRVSKGDMGFFDSIERFFIRLFKVTTYGPLKFEFRRNYGLTYRIEEKAVRQYNYLVYQFIQRKKRNPTRYEMGRIILNASHDLIGYKRNDTGHWLRQKVRHYLFNLNGISYKKR